MRKLVTPAGRVSLLLLSLSLASFIACGDSTHVDDGNHDAGTVDSGIPDAGVPNSGEPDSGVIDTGVPYECEEPATGCESRPLILPDEAAKAAGMKEVADLPADPDGPGMEAAWNDQLGTLSSAINLRIPIEDCTGSKDLTDAVLEFLGKHPALFQFDPVEWRRPAPVTCDELESGVDPIATLIFAREKFGPYDMVNDTFSVTVRRASKEGGDFDVFMSSFFGVYIPRYSAELVAPWNGCQPLSNEEAQRRIACAPFEYDVFAPLPALPCTREEGDLLYTALTTDSLTFSDDAPLAFWDVSGLDKGFRLQLERTATLTVAERHHSYDLIRSDANCPLDIPEGATVNRIGWRRTFDAFTGELIRDNSTPVEGCWVCLTGGGATAAPGPLSP